MSLILRIAAMLVLALAVPAVASEYGAATAPVQGFPYRHSAFDFRVAWKTSQTDKGALVQGLMKNVRYAYVEGVEVTVSLVNKDGKVLARRTDFAVPQQVAMGEVREFDLPLSHVAFSSGDKLEFTIRYRANEGGEDSFTWMSSFTVDALTGAPIPAPAATSDEW